MPLRVPVTATDVLGWIRKCAGTVNELIGITDDNSARLAALEAGYPGPFLDDTAAALGGVDVGRPYNRDDGLVAWRVT